MSRYATIGKSYKNFLVAVLGLNVETATKASLAFQSEAGQRELPVKAIRLGKVGKDGGFKTYGEKLESLKNVKVTPALEIYKAMEVLSELPEGFEVKEIRISESARDWLKRFEAKEAVNA